MNTNHLIYWTIRIFFQLLFLMKHVCRTKSYITTAILGKIFYIDESELVKSNQLGPFSSVLLCYVKIFMPIFHQIFFENFFYQVPNDEFFLPRQKEKKTFEVNTRLVSFLSLGLIWRLNNCNI